MLEMEHQAHHLYSAVNSHSTYKNRARHIHCPKMFTLQDRQAEPRHSNASKTEYEVREEMERFSGRSESWKDERGRLCREAQWEKGTKKTVWMKAQGHREQEDENVEEIRTRM